MKCCVIQKRLRREKAMKADLAPYQGAFHRFPDNRDNSQKHDWKNHITDHMINPKIKTIQKELRKRKKLEAEGNCEELKAIKSEEYLLAALKEFKNANTTK